MGASNHLPLSGWVDLFESLPHGERERVVGRPYSPGSTCPRLALSWDGPALEGGLLRRA
ncbi:MAG: hypothetical protein ACP5G2_05085 [Candidatus Bipolaricaulaceae bacterium]